MELDADDKWKRVVGLIKNSDGSPRYDEIHLKTFERQNAVRGGSPADTMLRDWQTQVPTITNLLEVLHEAELIDLVNFVREKILGIEPLSLNPVVGMF